MQIIIHFPFELNTSIQAGDTVYWTETSSSTDPATDTSNIFQIGVVTDMGDGTFMQANPTLFNSTNTYIGSSVYTSIMLQSPVYNTSTSGAIFPQYGNTLFTAVGGEAQSWIEISNTPQQQASLGGIFNAANPALLFSKHNKANLASVLGYYSLVSFSNDSTEHAELFEVGTDLFESSR